MNWAEVREGEVGREEGREKKAGEKGDARGTVIKSVRVKEEDLMAEERGGVEVVSGGLVRRKCLRRTGDG